MNKFVAFDIETTEVFQDGVSNSNITVAVTETSDGETLCWMSWLSEEQLTCPCSEIDLNEKFKSYADKFVEAEEKPMVALPQLSDDDVVSLYMYLEKKIHQGYVISTWNGASFDFQILAFMLLRADRLDLYKQCIKIAGGLCHVDIMFAFFANKGFCVSLGKVAQAMLNVDNTKTMDGKDAPAAWLKNGEMQLNVALYCVNDVRLQKEVHLKVMETGTVTWISRKENRQQWWAAKEMKHAVRIFKALKRSADKSKKRKRNDDTSQICDVSDELPQLQVSNYDSFQDFLSVKKSGERPLPDTEWMKKYEGMEPWERSKFIGWMSDTRCAINEER